MFILDACWTSDRIFVLGPEEFDNRVQGGATCALKMLDYRGLAGGLWGGGFLTRSTPDRKGCFTRHQLATSTVITCFSLSTSVNSRRLLIHKLDTNPPCHFLRHTMHVYITQVDASIHRQL